MKILMNGQMDYFIYEFIDGYTLKDFVDDYNLYSYSSSDIMKNYSNFLTLLRIFEKNN